MLVRIMATHGWLHFVISIREPVCYVVRPVSTRTVSQSEVSRVPLFNINSNIHVPPR